MGLLLGLSLLLMEFEDSGAEFGTAGAGFVTSPEAVPAVDGVFGTPGAGFGTPEARFMASPGAVLAVDGVWGIWG